MKKPNCLALVEALRPPDSHHLVAAQGWLELGNHVEANEELEKITPRLPGALEVTRIMPAEVT